MTKLIEAWRAGDVATVERIVLKDLQQETQLYQRLLVERNKNWMPKLEALFSRKRPAFVVVGAAHIVGPDGLLTMLKARGYTLEQQWAGLGIETPPPLSRTRHANQRVTAIAGARDGRGLPPIRLTPRVALRFRHLLAHAFRGRR